MPVKIEFTREELYQLVWEKPITYFTENYMVSYSSFKDICTINKIPLPPNGYWIKRKFGKVINKPLLPQTKPKGEIELLIRTGENSMNSNSSEKNTTINDVHMVSDLEVPKRLPKNPDPIIMEMLSDNPKNHPIINNCWDYTKRYNYGRISVSASGKPYKRALCFLNTFIKVMKARGHYFLFCYERSYVVIEGIEIGIRMRERSKRVYEMEKLGYRRSELIPIGLLSFLAGEFTEKEWQETPSKPLAEKLSTIITYLEQMAKEERKWKVENEKRLKKQAIEKKKQEEREKSQKEEIEKLRFIKQKSELWHEANKLRTFLNACDKNKELTEEMKELVKFCHQKADWLDPLTASKDEFFINIDPYKLLEVIK